MNSILLHICCAPCSTHIIKVLSEDFKVTGCFYNPNIYPEEEYKRRLKETERFAKIAGIELLILGFNPLMWQSAIKGLEEEKEGGSRCHICYRLRLEKTAELAVERGDDFFATTLTISPHKDADLINSIGEEVMEKFKVKFYKADFKKNNGFKMSCRLTKDYGLYRQTYCGCQYSIRDER